MILYLALLLCVIAAGYLFQVNDSPKRRGIYLACVGVVLILFAALRAESVGADTPQFASAYRQIVSKTWAEVLEMNYEKGFLVLCKLLSYLSSSPQLLIAFTAVLSIGSVCILVYFHSPDAVLSMTLFIGLQYFANYMNLMRQVVAMSLVFLAFEFLLRRFRFGWIPYLAVVALASFFHISALLLAVLCIFWYLPPRYLTVGIIGGASLFGIFFFSPLVQLAVRIVPKYAGYLESEYMVHGGLASALNLVIALAVLALAAYLLFREGRFRSPLREGEDHRRAFFFWCAFAALILAAFSLRAIIFDRLVFYFSVFLIVTVPLALDALPRKVRIYAKCAICVGAVAFCVVVLALRPEWTKVIPYKFFWAASVAA